MNEYERLGSSGAKLLNSFIGPNMYKARGAREGYDDVMRGNLSRAKMEGAQLDNEFKRRALEQNLVDELVNAMTSAPVRGQAPVEGDAFMPARQNDLIPPEEQQARKLASIVGAMNTASGGVDNTIQGLMSALTGGQEMIDRQNIQGGADPARTGMAYAATAGRGQFDQGVEGIVNKFTGEAKSTPLVESRINANNALTEKRKQDASQLSAWAKQKHPRDAYIDLTKKFLPQPSAMGAPMPEDVEFGNMMINDVMTQAFGANWKQTVFGDQQQTQETNNDDPLGIR